jgi:hypothetical protein
MVACGWADAAKRPLRRETRLLFRMPPARYTAHLRSHLCQDGHFKAEAEAAALQRSRLGWKRATSGSQKRSCWVHLRSRVRRATTRTITQLPPGKQKRQRANPLPLWIEL